MEEKIPLEIAFSWDLEIKRGGPKSIFPASFCKQKKYINVFIFLV